MANLIERMDTVISRVGKLSRREAFAELQDVFGLIKARPAVSETEVKRFFDLVNLILLVYPQGLTIRISGAGRTSIREERLRFDENYEVALERTMDFLARNFLNHLEEYAPLEYLRAALRALAKEYGIERMRQNETVSVGEPVEPDETEDGTLHYRYEPVQEEPPAYLKEYQAAQQGEPDVGMFFNWYVGTLSRRELARLHGMTEEQVGAAILRAAQEFERGRLFPLVNWLIGLKDDGDILLLFSKGLTGEQIGQKVAKSHWLIYKRLAALRKRFRQMKTDERTALTLMCRAEAC